MQNSHIFIRGYNVNAVGHDLHAVSSFKDLHLRIPLQQFRHHAFVCRIEMRNQYKCSSTVARHIAEELLKSLQRSSGSTHTDYVELILARYADAMFLFGRMGY